jgi:hypothetical protein
VVDEQGHLIAHPDISVVLRNTDMTGLAQVKAARAAGMGVPIESVQTGKDLRGRDVLRTRSIITATVLSAEPQCSSIPDETHRHGC